MTDAAAAGDRAVAAENSFLSDQSEQVPCLGELAHTSDVNDMRAAHSYPFLRKLYWERARWREVAASSLSSFHFRWRRPRRRVVN